MADIHSRFHPECSLCGDPAVGGVVDKYQDDVYTIRFCCGNHGETFAMTVAGMYPRWNAVSKVGRGIYRVMKSDQRPTVEVCR